MTTALHGRGRAVLCFPRGNSGRRSGDRGDCEGGSSSWFQGYVFLDAGGGAAAPVQLGILAEELPVDDCVRCPDGGYMEFRLTLLHFDIGQEVVLEVAKTGGDLCRLHCDELRFDASLLLSDKQAVDAIRTYFPAIAARADGDETELSDCLVVLGELEITGVDFQKPLPTATTSPE